MRQPLHGFPMIHRNTRCPKCDQANQIVERTRAWIFFVLASRFCFCPQIEQRIIEGIPVVLVLLDERFQLLTQCLVQNGVFVQMHLAVLADGVFHLARLRFG